MPAKITSRGCAVVLAAKNAYSSLRGSFDKTRVTVAFYNHTPPVEARVMIADGNSELFTTPRGTNYDK